MKTVFGQSIFCFIEIYFPVNAFAFCSKKKIIFLKINFIRMENFLYVIEINVQIQIFFLSADVKNFLEINFPKTIFFHLS